MKLTSPSPSSFLCRNAAAFEHPCRRALFFTDEPPPAIPRPTQTLNQVRLEPLLLPGPLALAESPESGRPPFPAFFFLELRTYLLDLNLLKVLSAKV